MLGLVKAEACDPVSGNGTTATQGNFTVKPIKCPKVSYTKCSCADLIPGGYAGKCNSKTYDDYCGGTNYYEGETAPGC